MQGIYRTNVFFFNAHLHSHIMIIVKKKKKIPERKVTSLCCQSGFIIKVDISTGEFIKLVVFEQFLTIIYLSN